MKFIDIDKKLQLPTLGYSAVFAKSIERLAHPDPCSQKKDRILVLASIYTVSVVLL